MFSIEGPLIKMFSSFQVCFLLSKLDGETYGNEKWKMPVIGRVGPIGWSFLGDQCPSVGGLCCDWRTRASQNLLHPQISTFPWLSPTESPLPDYSSSLQKAGAPLHRFLQQCTWVHFLKCNSQWDCKALHIFLQLNGSAERFCWKRDMHSYTKWGKKKGWVLREKRSV